MKRRLRSKPALNPAPYRIKSQPCGRHTILRYLIHTKALAGVA